ncbi:MAG: UvrD-helicase domain-containing protein [Candidatus Hydrothermales bacterium]
MLQKKLGKYEILRWLGGGTFGDVYLVRDTLIDKLFAIKVPRIRKEEWEILKREAKVLSELLHENIVRFYSVDIIENNLIMTMEYVEGFSLRNLIKSAPVDEDLVLKIFKKVLLALSYAHSRGFLHRDLKPENILLTSDYEPKISDFGLALIFQEKVSGNIVGTPLYLAPEGWRGNYSEKTDIFAVGCMMYECFTGFPPFQGRTFEEIREKIKKGNFKRLTENVSENTRRVIEKAIDPDPEKRFKTAKEMYESLEEGLKVSYMALIDVKIGDKKKNILEDLTDEQRDAVTTEERFVLVVGGAGTGKTTCLIRRASYLIEVKNFEPEEIIITTFTGKGINEIKSRLMLLLSKKNFISLNVSTLHSLGLQVIYTGGERIGFNMEEAKVISRSESFQIIRNNFTEFSQVELEEVIKTISVSKINLLTPEDLLRSDYAWLRKCGLVYKRYSEILRENNLLDYDDLIFYSNLILDNYEDIKERFSENIKYLLVDEFQDLSYGEVSLLRKLREKGGSLFATGDPDQAIYGFKGASTEFINNFEKYFENSKIYYLTKSFRIPEHIYEAGLKILSKIKDRKEFFFTPAEKKGERIFVFHAEDEKEEAKFISKEIKILLSQGTKEEKIAVLSRFSYYLKNIQETLKKENIPFNVEGKSRFYTKSLVRALIGYLESVQFSKREVLKKTLKYFLGNKKISEDILKLWKTHQKEKFSKTPFEIVDEFLEKINFYEFLKNLPPDQEKEERETLDEFFFLLREYKAKELKKFLDSFSILESLETDSKEGGVFLSTIHGAKGLEFDVVFITGVAESIIPSIRSLSQKKELDEERRLFYVALTRSCEKVFITRPKMKAGKKLTPSRFIEEMIIS